MFSIRRRPTAFGVILCGGAFLTVFAIAEGASGALTGKRQHRPLEIRPKVAHALESGRYEAAQKFTLFKPDGTPLRAKVTPSPTEDGARGSDVEVRGWDYKQKKQATGKSRARRRGRLVCRGERACVSLIAVRKACAPRSVKCGRRSCSCRSRH